MDPSNNKMLYAATYQRRRAQWGFNGGGPGSAIWKSTDGGQTWTKLENGMPAGPKGRIGLDVYRAQPERRLRAHRARDRERRLSLRRRRRDLAEDERHQSAADVLQPDPHRSADRLAHLRARRRSCTSPTTAARPSATTAPSASTSITTRCGSTRPIRNHMMIGNDGGVSISLRSRATPGSGCPTSSPRRPTTSSSTCRRRITSAPACRTTTPGAARARCAPTAASPTTTGT